MYEGHVWNPVEGYELAAAVYDAWHWQEFWRRNELPEVMRLVGLPPHAQSPLPAPAGLDVGCGTGTYLVELQGVARMTGVDPSARMLAEARRKVGDKVPLLLGTLEKIPALELEFDFALCTRTLCHSEDVGAAAREVGRVVRKGGRWIVSEVHDRHAYPRTRIPLGDQDIHIQTHKRTAAEIATEATTTGCWRLEGVNEYSWAELAWKPMDPRFARIDTTGNRPVFFMMSMRRV